MEPEILFSRDGAIGKAVLNRPQALNALTLGMCDALEKQLREWAEDPSIKAITIRGAGERAFCAGGDIRRLYEAYLAEDEYPALFWTDEYRLNALIKHMPKPYMALLDGIFMGGGVGVSVHGSHRIATEFALFAMPETGIGFFPDVGASFFLPRCPGALGLYIGLTGARLKAADLLYAGIATHHVKRAKLDALERALAARPDEIDAVLEEFSDDPGAAPLAALQNDIDRLFGQESVDAILAAIEREASPFARDTLTMLSAKSPTSLAVTFRELREGALMSFNECMQMEWRLASHVPDGLPDFIEGVRATVIDKDNRPRWSPPRLTDIDPQKIEKLFDPSVWGELDLY